MPELAEVEYYRRQWDSGIGKRVGRVELHKESRVFRDVSVSDLKRFFPGATLSSSEARGKQMLFGFSRGLWLGLHLGMTGTLRVEKLSLDPGKHDHLAIYQSGHALVFCDPRQFGRVRFHRGSTPPQWWLDLPPAVLSESFSVKWVESFLAKHRKLPVKATLLLQSGFPGIGNWMADEILWRAELNPHRLSGALPEESIRILWRIIRWVSRGAMKHISRNFADPPRGWLYHDRWAAGGRCPIDHTELRREEVGGRTSAWCPVCQK